MVIARFGHLSSCAKENELTTVQATAHATKIEDLLKKGNIEKALEELKKAHKSHDVAAIDAALANLNSIWQVASEEMYKNSQGAQGAEQNQQSGPQPGQEQGGSQKGPGNDEVTDVDFEEVKDK